MNIKSTVTLATLSLLSLNVNAGHTKLNETTLLQTLANTIQSMNQHPNAVWPNFNLSSDPLVLYFKKSKRLYATHFTPHNPNWQTLNINDQPFYLLSQKGFDIAQYRFKTNNFGYNYIDNQNAFIAPDDSKYFCCEDSIIRKIEWEVIAPKFMIDEYHSSPAFKKAFDHFSLNDESVNKASYNQQNLHLTYLELSALKQYLLQKNVEALKDYIAIHHYRLTQLDTDTLAYKKSQGWMNLVNYVAWKSTHLELDQDASALSILGNAPRTTLGADLLLMSTSPEGKIIPNLTRATVILSPEGLYVVDNPYQPVSELVLDASNNQAYFDAAWEQLTGSQIPSDKSLQPLTPELSSSIDQLNLLTERTSISNELNPTEIRMMLSAPDFTGPALGYALDTLDPQGLWKQTIHSSAISMDDVLEQQFPMTTEEILQRINKAEQNPAYDFQAMSTAIDNAFNADQSEDTADSTGTSNTTGEESTPPAAVSSLALFRTLNFKSIK